MSPKPVATVTVAEKDSQSARERSLSPVSKTQEYPREEGRISQHLLPSANSILRRQAAAANESTVSLPSNPHSIHVMHEHDENALHGSSEFMLVLYPEDETREKDANEIRIGSDAGKREEKVAKSRCVLFNPTSSLY